MSRKLDFEDELLHAFGNPEDFGQGGTLYHCRHCGVTAASPEGNGDLCTARLHQRLVDIKNMVEDSCDARDTMMEFYEMFGIDG